MDTPAGRVRALLDSHRSLRYVLVGAGNTVFSYAVYGAAVVMGLSVPMASLLALVLGVLVGFLTQGQVVFRSLSAAAFGRFVAAWGCLYGLFVGVVSALATVGLGPLPAGVLATGLNTAVSYFVLRDLVFHSPR